MNKSAEEICNLLRKARKENNQELINRYAYQLASMVYELDDEIDFDGLLKRLGYQKVKVKRK